MTEKALIFSAPSGSGKTTVVQHLLKYRADLSFSISATTRSPRGKEKEGEDYYFLSVEQFKKRITEQHFIEFEEVYEGVYYGTLMDEVERLWTLGKVVVFDVDVKGGINLKKKLGKKALSVFIKAPNKDVVESRLRIRGTESEENISKRLAKFEEEMMFEGDFGVVLVNEDLSRTFSEAEALIADFIGNQ